MEAVRGHALDVGIYGVDEARGRSLGGGVLRGAHEGHELVALAEVGLDGVRATRRWLCCLLAQEVFDATAAPNARNAPQSGGQAFRGERVRDFEAPPGCLLLEDASGL